LDGTIAIPTRNAGNFTDEVNADDRFAKHRVFVVEVRGGSLGNEELTSIRVRTRVRHRENAGFAVPELGVELIREAITWVSDAPAEWASALDHEIRDDAVEDRSIVEWNAAMSFARAGVLPLLCARC